MQGGGQPGQKQGGSKCPTNASCLVLSGGWGLTFLSVVVGFVKSLMPQTQQQQQQTVTSPAQTQHPPNSVIDPTRNTNTLTTAPPTTMIPSGTSNQLTTEMSQTSPNPPSPARGGILNQSNSNRPGLFNGGYPIPPPPSHPTPSESLVPQIPNNTNVDPSPTMPSTVRGMMSLPSYSAGSLDYTSEPDDPNADAIPDQSSYPDRDLSEDGDEEDGEDEVSVGDVDFQSVKSSVYPPSISTSESTGTCRLEGCSSTTFVDSITDLESEYCSRKHQE